MTGRQSRPAPHTVLMLVLSFGTGILDAATYLGLHGAFTANMTGNLIFVGLALGGAGTVALLRPASALVGFAVGAAIAGRGFRAPRERHPYRSGVVFALVAAVIVGATVVLVVDDHSPVVLDVLTPCLAAAMGAQGLAARRIGVADVTTVVVTSTLTAFAGENPLTGRTAGRADTLRRGAAILTMGLGALLGAILLRWHVAAAIGADALVCASVAIGTLVTAGRTPTQPEDEVAAPMEHAEERG